jgi:threonine synthase
MLGISKIFLKLEGNNPSGNKIDRLAIMLIRDAIAVNKHIICLGGYNDLAKALAYTSQFFDINCVFVFGKNNKLIKSPIFNKTNIKIVQNKSNNKQDCINKSKKLSKENGWYNANPGFENAMVNMTAYSIMADELNKQLKEPITTLFAQTSFGYVISGLHLGFRRLWMEDNFKKIPILHSCTTNYGNIIYKEYKENNMELAAESLKKAPITKYNKNVITSQTKMIKNALDAIYDTGGQVTGISDKELETYVNKVKELEKIKMSIQNGYAIAGFMKEAEAGNLTDGNHVIILNDGKINIDIEEIEKGDIEVDDIVEMLNTWLMEYTDPEEEIKDAVENAFENGYILAAIQNNDIKGISVIVNLGFKKFIPTYHLGYIATKQGIKGKGIATQLLSKAIEVTDGNISLHVDRDNKRAIKVYEKMGFKQSYIRMIHK